MGHGASKQLKWQLAAAAAAAVVIFLVWRGQGGKPLTEQAAAAIRQALASDAVLLDVRTTTEFQAGHLPRAINIPLGDLPQQLKRLPRKRSLPLVVYCRSGSRSATAATFLRSKGFGNVLDLGGKGNWRQVSP